MSSDPSSDPSFVIAPIEGRGNALIATRDIRQGELIFAENPAFWHSRCGASGTTTDGGGDVDINARVEGGGGREGTRELCKPCGRVLLPSSNIVNCTSSAVAGQPHKCSYKYCSRLCRDRSLANGHRWMCSDCSNLDLYQLLAELDGLDNLGHFGLALVTYCKIAEAYCSERLQWLNASNGGEEGPRPTPESVSKRLLDGFHATDYCRSLHAWRSGQIIVDEDMFQSIIRPAYFASHLEKPLTIICRIMSDLKPWGVHMTLGDMGEYAQSICAEDLQRDFTESSIMTDHFFSNLCGIFVSNNLQIQIRNNPDVNSVFRSNSSNNDSNDTSDGDKDQDNCGVFRADGTGLFHLYSKMNHSCECNTVNSNDTKASIRVFASRAISIGEEITTSYLHSNANTASVRKRNKELVQYLFRCKCSLCQQQRDQSGLDSDDCSSSEEEDEEEDD